MIKKLCVAAALTAGLVVTAGGVASATHSHHLETPGSCTDRNGEGFGTGQLHFDNSSDPGDTTFHERFHKGTPGTFALELDGNPVAVVAGLCPS